MVEHVMAALSALEIDNCVVELDATEPPGGDGSSQVFADAILHAGLVELDRSPRRMSIAHPVAVGDTTQSIRGLPGNRDVLTIRYSLDYGIGSPIAPQVHEVDISPATFLNEIVFARTFLLEEEAELLRSQGYGRRTTAKDLLIFNATGVVDNQLRTPNECARHKLLDCIGDFALSGYSLTGRIEAHRSGHTLNAEFIQRLMSSHEAGIHRHRPKAA
jgi:UDP-3-O-acyl-N-acetylglucosamine deacetylase